MQTFALLVAAERLGNITRMSGEPSGSARWVDVTLFCDVYNIDIFNCCFLFSFFVVKAVKNVQINDFSHFYFDVFKKRFLSLISNLVTVVLSFSSLCFRVGGAWQQEWREEERRDPLPPV